MSPKKMNRTLKIILLVIIILIVAGLFFADKKLQHVSKQTVELKAQIEADSKKLAIYELTKIKVDELGYIKNLAAQILPQNEEQSVVVAELAAFAKRSNLQTGSITFAEGTQAAAPTNSKNKDKAKVSTVPKGVELVPVVFTVSESASYEDVLGFLKYIEQNRRKMQITQISLTPNSDDANKLDDVSVSLNLFVKSTEAEKKAP